MIKWLFCAALFTGTQAFAQTQKPASSPARGHQISITLTPLKNQKLYLYSYYGKNYEVADSTVLDGNSQGVFKGPNKLPGGIYIVVSDKRVRLFDFLMDKTQHFSLRADTSALDKVSITGSAENDIYTAYSKFLASRAPEMNRLQQSFAQARSAADSAAIREKLNKANRELTDYRDKVIREHPNSMLALFFQAVKRPEPPAIPVSPDGKADSSYPLRYVKEHYWDDVPFNDDRLLRTPFFDPKLEEYFKYYVSPDPDSIIQEVNYMLLSAREGKDMFKYLLGRFTDKYINPEIMGQDKVFVFLFNNFFSKGDTTWLNAKQKEYIFNRAYSLMANQIGEAAPVMNLTDTSGRESSLYGLKAPFTFVVFWDPNCGHCKEVVPRIDSIYRASWKTLGVKIYAVNVDEKANEAWKKFIRDHKLEGWVHVYQPTEQRLDEQKKQIPNFRQLYDVFQTPTLYLLDKDKRIVAKKLSVEQFNDVMKRMKP